MPLPTLQTPPAVVAPPPSNPEAESALLEAFDWGRPMPSAPALKGLAALRYRWLRLAATFEPERGVPANPFATGRERKEAEGLRRLLRVPKEQLLAALKALSLRESGTVLALWRWGQIKVRSGAFDPALRRAWEDRLLAAGPALTRGYALRHALCWALAEQDEARFAQVRSAAGPTSEPTTNGFQRLFGLLGGPSPLLRLWTLPRLDYQDLRLDQLGTSRIWICPAEKGPIPAIPPGTAWIIPSAAGEQDERDANLTESLMAEGRSLASCLQSSGSSAHFAASRPAFERLGLVWFPILIELDGKGDIRSIRMGDAAPEKP